MNSREKFLILILSVVIVLFGGFKLLISPQLKAYSDTKAKYHDAVLRKKSVDETLALKDTIAARNKEMEKDISTAAARFFPEFQSDKVQLFFKNLGGNVGVSFDSFMMTTPVTVQIMSPSESNNSITYPLSEIADNVNALNSGGGVTSPKPSGGAEAPKSSAANILPADTVEMMSVSMQFTGTYEKTMALLNQIKNCGRLVRVSSADMRDDKGLTVTISVECFGVKKFTPDEMSVDSLPSPAGKNSPF